MKLFEPGNIGTLTLKNRLILLPMHIGAILELDGRISPQGIEYFAARARGGTALLMIGMVRIDREIEKIPAHWTDFMADSKIFISRISELAEAVHEHGAKLGFQLTPGWGRNAYVNVHPSIGAISPTAGPAFRDPRVMTHELTTKEVETLVKDFEIAAEISRIAGCDLIEVHGHDGYVLDSFTDPLFNKRTDKYGGSLDNRLRFPLEALAACKRGAGKDFPVTYRLALVRNFEGGRGLEEGLEICRRLEAAGADALNIDAGMYEVRYWAIPPTTQPPGCMVNLAEMAKKVVKVPIITAGKLGYPELAEKVLQEGKADFIGLARSLLADPEWPNKVREGRWDDIRPCIGDNEGCIGRQTKKLFLSCTVNPMACQESNLPLTPAEKKKRVLVVGGGPGGMEAARVAALRGHKVTLWEKTNKLGGNLIPAAVPDFKQDYRRYIDYLSNQMRKVGVNVELSKEATPQAVLQARPDVVFIATGGTPCTPEIPGVNKRHVAHAIEVLLGKKTGKAVVVIGGGLVGTETALYLAQQGKKVTIVEVLEKIIGDVFMSNRQHLLKLLDDAKVKILTETKVLEIGDKAIKISVKNGKATQLAAATVVLAAGMKANDGLSGKLVGKIPEVYPIGDCVQPRRVLNAVWEGFRKARII